MDAPHSSLPRLRTATNATSHKRFFEHNRKSALTISLPSSPRTPGRALIRKNAHLFKYNPSGEEVDVIECTPSYARKRFSDEREDAKFVRQLTPPGETHDSNPEPTNRGIQHDSAGTSKQTAHRLLPILKPCTLVITVT